jgi:DNA-binding SARP family transcriptional activator
MEFRILGPIEVLADGEPLEVGVGKQRALLALMLLKAGEVVSTDRLIDALWGERPPASALNSVRIYVSHLRKTLGSERLVTRARGYALAVAPGELDLDRFEQLAADGRAALAAGDAGRAAATLHDALALWRGPPLADVALEPCAPSELARLEALRLAALEYRVDADLALGRHAELVPELQALVDEHPLRERLGAQLMLALYRSGRQADALASYRQARRALQDQVGLEPGPELRRLEQAILTHDPSLELGMRVMVVNGASRRLLPATLRRRLVLVGTAVLVLAALVTVAVALTLGPSPRVLAALQHDAVGIVDPARNVLVDEIRLHARPAAIAYGAGSLWVATYDHETLLQIDPETHEVVRTMGLGAEPSAIAVGDGFVWVLCGSAYRLFQYDARTGAVVRKVTLTRAIRVGSNRGLPYAPLDVGYGEPFDLDAGAGAAWVGYAHAVSRVDAASGAVKQIRAGSSGAIGFGEDAAWAVGKLWFDSPQAITRIDARTWAIDKHFPQADIRAERALNEVVAGLGGVWAVSEHGRRAWKVDPELGRVKAVVPLDHGPVDVALGERAVWTANDDGTVSRIEPRTGTLAQTIPLGDYPRIAYPVQLATGGGLVWVAVH